MTNPFSSSTPESVCPPLLRRLRCVWPHAILLEVNSKRRLPKRSPPKSNSWRFVCVSVRHADPRPRSMPALRWTRNLPSRTTRRTAALRGLLPALPRDAAALVDRAFVVCLGSTTNAAGRGRDASRRCRSRVPGSATRGGHRASPAFAVRTWCITGGCLNGGSSASVSSATQATGGEQTPRVLILEITGGLPRLLFPNRHHACGSLRFFAPAQANLRSGAS